MLNEDGKVVDFKTFMALRKDYTIVDVWHMIGLSGTGYNDIVVEEEFIHEAITLSMGETGQCRWSRTGLALRHDADGLVSPFPARAASTPD